MSASAKLTDLLGTGRDDRGVLERLLRLQAVTDELAGAATVERIAEIVVDHGVAAIGATSGGVFLFDDERTHVTAVRSIPSLDRAWRVPVEGTPLGDAMRTGTAILVESREEYAARYPVSEARSREYLAPTLALAALPMIVGGEAIGGITFAFEGARAFQTEDRVFLNLLAHHCAQAFERTRFIENERRAAARLRIVAEASRAFSAVQRDLSSLLDALAGQVVKSIGDSCTVLLISADRTHLVPEAIRHRNHETEAAIRATLGREPVRAGETTPGMVAKSGLPVLVPVVPMKETLERMATEHRAHLERYPIASLLAVPIRHTQEIVGVLVLTRDEAGSPYTADDQSLVEDIAHRASLAIGNARSYAEAAAARQRAEELARQAEEASRLKDEFLATVSHELRTPLSSILGWSAMLLARPDPASLAKGLAVIERNARSQLRIVEDILDVSRIVRGQLLLLTEVVDAEALVRDLFESLKPAASAKDLDLQLLPSGAPVRLVADPERLRQILWNLVSNAVKFTPARGEG
jgi:K+-sensing histidine kinase KdpD